MYQLSIMCPCLQRKHKPIITKQLVCNVFFFTNVLLPGVDRECVKERRSVKRPRLNEIFVLPSSYSEYTIFSVKLKWPRACQCSVTPRRLPILVPRKALPGRSSRDQLTPVRDRLRKHVNSESVGNDSFSLDKSRNFRLPLFPWNWLRLMSEVIQ